MLESSVQLLWKSERWLIIQQRFPGIKLSGRVWPSFRPLTSEQECVGQVSAAARDAGDELSHCQRMSNP